MQSIKNVHNKKNSFFKKKLMICISYLERKFFVPSGQIRQSLLYFLGTPDPNLNLDPDPKLIPKPDPDPKIII
jgi:hypothetical protein